jgi:predicted DNA-binding transcriptional regulator AlpA
MENAQPCAVAAHSDLSHPIRKLIPLPRPRVWGAREIAARLNRSVAWFYEHKARLKQLGFPSRDEVIGGWDSYAVEAWLDRRAGTVNTANIEDQMLEAIRGDS